MSRKNRNVIIGVAIFLLILLAALDYYVSDNDKTPVFTSTDRSISSDIQKYHSKTFIVINVVDGDTFDIDIPDGEDDHTRIRLLGIDTPETRKSPKGKMYYGAEAAEFVRELVLDKEVTVFLDEGTDEHRGYYGRLLAYVRLPNGQILNEVLLSDGYAYADVRFRHSFYNKYKQLEASARSLKKGLWEGVTTDQMPAWKQK